MAPARIRRARPGDADALTACIDAAYAADRARLPDLPDVSAGVAEDIAAERVWVADLGGVMLGGMILIEAADHLQLANIAIHPAARGKGLARKFLTLAEAQAAARALPELRLATHAGMPRNIALYRHLGWSVTDQAGDKVFMTKPVPAA